MATQTHPIEEIVSALGIEVMGTSAKELSARCPFHADNHPSFSISWSGVWICFQCGRSGRLEQLIDQLGGEGSTITEMVREARLKAVGRPQGAAERPVPLWTPARLQARYETFKRPPAWALDQRRINAEQAELYGVRFDKAWIIPIREPAEPWALWGWQVKRADFVRNVPSGVKKSETLFGLRELWRSKVAVVESPLDVLRLAMVKVPAVATYGAFVSRAQIQLIIESVERVTLALDNDDEGRRQTARLYPVFAKHMPTEVAAYPPRAKDPGDCTDRQCLEVFAC